MQRKKKTQNNWMRTNLQCLCLMLEIAPELNMANKTKNTLIQMQNSKKTMHKTLQR